MTPDQEVRKPRYFRNKFSGARYRIREDHVDWFDHDRACWILCSKPVQWVLDDGELDETEPWFDSKGTGEPHQPGAADAGSPREWEALVTTGGELLDASKAHERAKLEGCKQIRVREVLPTPPAEGQPSGPLPESSLDEGGFRKCEFCGCNTNAKARRCCAEGQRTPALVPDIPPPVCPECGLYPPKHLRTCSAKREPEREGGTPRTDAHIKTTSLMRQRRWVHPDFARTLEREVNQLRSILGRIGELVAGPVFDAQDVSAEFLERLVPTVRNRLAAKDARIAELESPWQPIETAPRDGTKIIGSWFAGDGFLCASDAWFDSEQAAWRSEEGVIRPPTHWIPLPAEPRAKAEGVETK